MLDVHTGLTRSLIDGAEVAHTDSGGDGEPLLLIHGGGLADWLTPLAATPELKGYRVIRMVRAGYTGRPVPAGLTVADHARHAATLLRQLDAAPAHVVAHSSGSAIALQLAVDDPSSVRTVALCEPPLVDTLADPADRDALHAAFGPVLGSAMAATARGDHAAAFDAFMALVCGPGYRAVLDGVLGAGPVDDAARHSGDFFTGELPAVGTWTFDPAVIRPVLLIQGADSPPPVHRLIAHVAGLLPESSVVTVGHADHLMPLTAPAELGDVVARFCRSRRR
ncbi:alpha/beta fold hydrolase [Actinoplanes auranticolor]|uniref:Alpha/beta hydrolase n=1 Tax=Actinoplanes auranticolor TaxID=47988 RepID=A0A919VSN3_9ACTN|nr:alpha/beta hydrolase [Actinoplanes auranticolor]GIM74020.1 alpha/beta hydrolase [Actinoplanes auranticolor]